MKKMLVFSTLLVVLSVGELAAQRVNVSELDSLKACIHSFITKLQNRPVQVLSGVFPLKYPSLYEAGTYTATRPYSRQIVHADEKRIEYLERRFKLAMQDGTDLDLGLISEQLSRALSEAHPAYVVTHSFRYSPDGKKKTDAVYAFEISSDYRITRIIKK